MAKPNRYEEDARARKVAAIVQQIDADLSERGGELDPLVVSAQVSAYTPSDWERIRRRAGTTEPSAETIAQVCRRFVIRATESLDDAEPVSGEYASGEAFS